MAINTRRNTFYSRKKAAHVLICLAVMSRFHLLCCGEVEGTLLKSELQTAVIGQENEKQSSNCGGEKGGKNLAIME